MSGWRGTSIFCNLLYISHINTYHVLLLLLTAHIHNLYYTCAMTYCYLAIPMYTTLATNFYLLLPYVVAIAIYSHLVTVAQENSTNQTATASFGPGKSFQAAGHPQIILIRIVSIINILVGVYSILPFFYFVSLDRETMDVHWILLVCTKIMLRGPIVNQLL